MTFGPSGDGVDSIAEIQGDGEGSHVEGFEVGVLEVDTVSESAEADVGDFSGGGSIPGDGIEGAQVVPVLVDEEVAVVVGDVGHVGEGGRGEVVPVFVPQLDVHLIAADRGAEDNPLYGPRGIPDGVDRQGTVVHQGSGSGHVGAGQEDNKQKCFHLNKYLSISCCSALN